MFWKLPIFTYMVVACQVHSYVFNIQKPFLKIPGFTIVYVLKMDKLDVGSVNKYQILHHEVWNLTTKRTIVYIFTDIGMVSLTFNCYLINNIITALVYYGSKIIICIRNSDVYESLLEFIQFYKHINGTFLVKKLNLSTLCTIKLLFSQGI